MPSKLNNLILTNAAQENDISLQKWIELHILTRIDTTNPRDVNLTKTVQWDSDWETVESLIEAGVVTKVWKQWRIPIGQINQRWLTRFSVEMIFRNGNSLFQVSNSSLFKKSFVWDIQDVVGKETSDLKNITLVAFVYSQFLNHPVFEAKLLVKYINQTNHD
jgi:hypothetical protein